MRLIGLDCGIKRLHIHVSRFRFRLRTAVNRPKSSQGDKADGKNEIARKNDSHHQVPVTWYQSENQCQFDRAHQRGDQDRITSFTKRKEERTIPLKDTGKSISGNQDQQ